MGFFDFFKGLTTAPSEPAPESTSESDRTLKKITCCVVGTQYYSSAINSLARTNPDWKKSGSVLASEGKVMERIYKSNYINKPVKLVPEPQNKHDKNAIKVTISDKKVGYISRDENLQFKDILAHNEVKFISAFVSGGPYKIVTEGGDISMLEDHISIRVRIGYV